LPELIRRPTLILGAAEVLQNSTRTDVDGRKVAKREAVNQPRTDVASLDISAWNAESGVIGAGRSLGRDVLAIGLEVPVRSYERAEATAVTDRVTEVGVQSPIAIEFRPRSESAY